MADCELVVGCLFFNNKMKDTQGVAALFNKRYCRKDNTECARHVVAKSLGRAAVPENLYPNMLDKAQSLTAGK